MAYPIAAATSQHQATSTTVTVTLPTHAAGDLIVIFLSQNVGSTAISESSAYSWTVRNPANANGDMRMAVAYKYSTGGGESNPTFTGTATNAWSVQTVVVRDADPTTYVAGYASNTFTTNPAASPALSTAAADDDYGSILLLYAWGFDGSSTAGRTKSDDLVALGKDYGDKAGVTDTSVGSIVGYRLQATYGAVPSINAYAVTASEGGNAWVLAIKNKSGGVIAPDVRSGATEFQWYGNFGVAHQNPTWDAPSNFTASTIGGIATDTTLADKANISFPIPWASFQWGAATYLEVNTTTEEWVGGSHPISSTSMTGKIFYLQWATSASNTQTNVGANGFIVGFSDGTKWVTYQLSSKAMYPTATSPVGSHIALGNATEFANSEGTTASTINWGAITRVLYAYHRNTGVAGYTTIYIQNAMLLDTSVITGGSASRAAKFADLKTCLEGWGAYRQVDKQGNTQILVKNKVQLGDGTVPTYFKAGASAMEFPPAYSASVQNLWNAKANSVSLKIKASSADTISLSAGLMATETAQAFSWDAASSSAASYPMTAATLVGFDVTLTDVIPISGATLSSGSKVAGSSTDITNMVITGTTASDAAYSVSADGSVITSSTIDCTKSDGTFASYCLELGTAVTAITLTDVTFSGTPGTDKVHVLKTTGTVTITISGTTSLAAGDVTTAGATVVIAAPTPTLSATVLASSRVVLYNNTTSSELDNTAPAGTSWSKVITTGASSGDSLTLHVFKEGYAEFSTSFLYAGANATILVTQAVDANVASLRTELAITDYTTITEFVLDITGTVEIDADDTDGNTLKARLVIWYNGVLTTENGARYLRGAITILSTAAFRINVTVLDLQIANISVTYGLNFTDTERRLYRSDGTPIYAAASAAGSIQNDYSGVPDTVETGVSGLTGSESAQLMGLPSAATTVTAIFADAVDGTTTFAESIRLHNSVLGGKVSGAGTSTETFRDLADTKNRVVATVDSSGNRTAITRTLT